MKMKIFLMLIVTFMFATVTMVNGATVNGSYTYTTYDNEAYNLIDGVKYDDINYSITNKVLIALNNIGDRIYFDDSNFSHVLFYDAYHAYLGYSNGDGSTLELDTYISDLIPDGSDFYVEAPERARQFALMNYNYDDTKNLLAYTQPSIDIDAWGALSYRDIFAGNDLIINGDFSVDDVEPLELADEWNHYGVSTSFFNDDSQNLINNVGDSHGIQNDVGLNYPAEDNDTLYLSINAWLGATNQNITTSFLYGVRAYNSGGSAISNETVDLGILTTIKTNYSDLLTIIQGGDIAYIRGWLYRYGDSVNISDYHIDDFMIYNFNDIFDDNGELQPSISEFETMLEYYNKYKDVSGDTLTYEDIFSNNLVANGTFDSVVTPWITTGGAVGVIDNETLLITNITQDSTILYQTSINMTIDELYYYQMDTIDNLPLERLRMYNGVAYKTFADHTNNLGTGTYSTIQEILSTHSSINILIYSDDIDLNVSVDNILLYNLTVIFGGGDVDIDSEFMEDGYDIWLDPYADYYPTYYQLGTMVALSVWYEYDDTEAPPPDFQNTFESRITDLGIDTDAKKLFGAFLIMAITAILLGWKFRSVAIILITEIALIFIFTVLGWFDIWFILVVAILFVLLLIIKGLKGGN